MAFTGILGTSASQLGNIVLGMGAGEEPEVNAHSASNTLVLVSSADTPLHQFITSPLALNSQFTRLIPISVSSILALADSAADNTQELSILSTLELVQTALPGLLNLSVQSVLTLSQVGYAGQIVVASASNALVLTDAARSGLFNLSVSSPLALVQEALGDKNALSRSGQNTLELVFTATSGPKTYFANLPFDVVFPPYLNLVQTVVVAGPKQLSASNALSLGQMAEVRHAIANKSVSHMLELIQTMGRSLEASASSVLELLFTPHRVQVVSSVLTLVDSAQAAKSKVASNTLALFDNASRQVIFTRALANTLNLVQGAALYRIQSCIEQNYEPTVGTGDGSITPPSVIDPVLSPTQVLLTYPYSGPSLSITLRKPDFGNGHRLDFARISRETRGGTLQVFADPNWPKMQILSLDFSNLTSAQRDSLLNFLLQSIGKEVGLRDWENRQWRGIINNPDAEITQTGRCSFAMQLEFEGVLA